VVADEIPVPAAGGPQTDAYAPQQGVGDHLAVVSSAVFNTQDATGDWVDASFVEDDYGWSLTTPSFTIRFPTRLSPATPIRYQIGDGEISSVPTGALDVPGQATGPTALRYDDALPGADFLYEVSSDGYKETVLLRTRGNVSLHGHQQGQGPVRPEADPVVGIALSAQLAEERTIE